MHALKTSVALALALAAGAAARGDIITNTALVVDSPTVFNAVTNIYTIGITPFFSGGLPSA